MRNRSVVETRLFRKVDLVADQGIISSQVLDFRTTLDLKVKLIDTYSVLITAHQLVWSHILLSML